MYYKVKHVKEIGRKNTKGAKAPAQRESVYFNITNFTN
jgi:hypothetical protein